jgi:sugar phosphate isomerase/epimerase
MPFVTRTCCWILILTWGVGSLTSLGAENAPSRSLAQDQDTLFARSNLVAWCIVPFDVKKRGPEERAQMLVRLGFKHFAYDWRDEHIPTFDTEIETMQRHGISIDAWWFPADLGPTSRTILSALKRHNVKAQLWITMGDPAPQSNDQAAKVRAAAAVIRPIAEAAAAIGCSVGLYNHGGWFGEPEHQIEIIKVLRDTADGATARLPPVGIVYNFHHGHDHIARFPELFRTMQPYLYAVNLNGMLRNGEQVGKKILTLGEGDQELNMLRVIRDSGWRGPIGILNHRDDTDAEETLRGNLEGLEKLREKLREH